MVWEFVLFSDKYGQLTEKAVKHDARRVTESEKRTRTTAHEKWQVKGARLLAGRWFDVLRQAGASGQRPKEANGGRIVVHGTAEEE